MINIKEKQNNISIDQTNNLKGFLIILVVLGHIQELIANSNLKLQMLLYSFHVVLFFMLPFLFNKDKLQLKNIKKNFKRVYVPYTIFFTIALLAYSFMYNQFNLSSIITAWIIGTAPLIKENIGISAFWFFPALMSTLLMIMFYNTLSYNNKKVLLLLLSLTHILITLLPNTYLKYFPLDLYIPLYLFVLGIIIKYIYTHLNWKNYLGWKIFLLFTLLLYSLYGTKFNLASPILPSIIQNPIDFILHDLLIIVSFFAIISLSQNLNFFGFFGKYSIAIYTIHPFIIQLVNKFYNWSSLTDGFIKFFIVIFLTYLIVKILYFVKLNAILYPR